MYPPVTQLKTRRELEAELRANRRSGRAGSGEPAGRPAGGPPRYRLALLTWAGAYGLITAILAVLGPAMASWPLVLRTLVLSAIMVWALTWLVMPRLTRLFAAWLNPRV